MCFCVKPPCELYIVYIITFQQTGRLERQPGATFPREAWDSSFCSQKLWLLLETNLWILGFHSYWKRKQSKVVEKKKLDKWIVNFHDASSLDSTASSDSQAEADSWILSVTSKPKAKIQGRGVVNPTAQTNWLLSPLRGINLSDLEDNACAMKWYNAHCLNT